MGFLDKFKKQMSAKQEENKLSWEESIQALNEEKISLQEFININAEHPLFYSTPAGENAEGKMVLWIINIPKLNMNFFLHFYLPNFAISHSLRQEERIL